MPRLILRVGMARMVSATQRVRRPTGPVDRLRSWLRLEVLEGRCLPSTVTNLNDGGPGSLRDAIATTPFGGTVDFQPGLSGTITLTTGELDIFSNLTISGPGAHVIAVSGNHASRVFYTAATVAMSGLTVTNGNSLDSGGGIYNASVLNLADCNINGNTARGPGSNGGGGIFNAGLLTITNSDVSDNSVPYRESMPLFCV